MEGMIQAVTPDETSTFTLASAGMESSEGRAAGPWNPHPHLVIMRTPSEGASPRLGNTSSSSGGDFNTLEDEDIDVESRQYSFFNENENGPINRNGYYAPRPTNDVTGTTTTTTGSNTSYKNHFPYAFPRSTPV